MQLNTLDMKDKENEDNVREPEGIRKEKNYMQHITAKSKFHRPCSFPVLASWPPPSFALRLLPCSWRTFLQPACISLTVTALWEYGKVF